MTVEERIERVARLMLVVLLLATLAWVGHAKSQAAAEKDAGAPLKKVVDPVLLGGPTSTGCIFALVRTSDPIQGDVLRNSRDLHVAIDAGTVDRIIEPDPSHARFFAGLVAWHPGELQRANTI